MRVNLKCTQNHQFKQPWENQIWSEFDFKDDSVCPPPRPHRGWWWGYGGAQLRYMRDLQALHSANWKTRGTESSMNSSQTMDPPWFQKQDMAATTDPSPRASTVPKLSPFIFFCLQTLGPIRQKAGVPWSAVGESERRGSARETGSSVRTPLSSAPGRQSSAASLFLKRLPSGGFRQAPGFSAAHLDSFRACLCVEIEIPTAGDVGPTANLGVQGPSKGVLCTQLQPLVIWQECWRPEVFSRENPKFKHSPRSQQTWKRECPVGLSEPRHRRFPTSAF